MNYYYKTLRDDFQVNNKRLQLKHRKTIISFLMFTRQY
jgi:hypothetical protein